MQFKNPPIVELVVELKWDSADAGQSPAGVPKGLPFPLASNNLADRFFESFLGSAAALGWKRSERLVPEGFPYLQFQPIFRLRSDSPDRSSAVMQLGSGIFSMHALRPYKSWEVFWPVVGEGIELLVNARGSSGGAAPFIGLTVMYLDIFEDSIVGSISTMEFLKDVLGIQLILPSVVSQQSAEQGQVDAQVSLKIPLRDGLEMRLNVDGRTVWGDRSGILMRMVVSSKEPVESSMARIASILEASHLAIRQTFMGLTEKLHSKMILMQERG